MTTEQICSCGDELQTEADLASGACPTCRLIQDSDLHLLLIAALPELGEIAECLIKDRPGHWKNKVADLCWRVIHPMLALAETDFETACKHGRKRQNEKQEAIT